MKNKKGFTPVKYKQSLSSSKTGNFTGFTLIEILIVIGIIIMLSAMIILSINPQRQFKVARDKQRKTHVSAIQGAIADYSARNEGSFPSCVSTSATNVTECASDLLPLYLQKIPSDPSEDCFYFVKESPAGRVGVNAECAEIEESITAGDWVE
jgi:type II secretory pathway pseudopilin PulG